MPARVEELRENKVRLSVDVPAHDMQHAVEHAASDLSASVKIPGFRKGKVPMPVLVSRIGKERLYSEAVESHIEGWYRNALIGTRIRPVARPEYDYELPDNSDADFSFTATVDVQPTVEVADWKGLQVGYAEAEVPPELVDQQIEALRFAVAELAPADRPAQAADTVVVDLVQPGGEAQRDYVIEVGAGRVLEEIEVGILGMSAGETKEVAFEVGDGQTQTVQITLKDVKEKILPPLDDDLARAAQRVRHAGRPARRPRAPDRRADRRGGRDSVPRGCRRRTRRRLEHPAFRNARRGAHPRTPRRSRPEPRAPGDLG